MQNTLKVFSIGSAGFGIASLVGWSVDIPLLSTFGRNNIPMAPSTALFFVLFGIVLYLDSRKFQRCFLHRWNIYIISITTILSMGLLLLSSLKIYSNAEFLGLHISGTVEGVPLGHMSPLTALCFILAGITYLSLSFSRVRSKGVKITIGLASILLVIAFVLVIGYLIGGPLLYGSSLIPPALTTSLAFFSLAMALLASSVVPDWSKKRLMDSDGVRAIYTLGLIFVLMTIGIVAIGFIYFQKYTNHYRHMAENELSAISELKTQDLLHWRKDRLYDASIFFHNKNFSERVGRLVDTPSASEEFNRLSIWLTKLRENNQYDRIMLVDNQLKIQISDPPTSEALDAHITQGISNAIQARQTTFQDFYRDTLDGTIHLAVLVPLFDEQNPDRSLGVLVLQINPFISLYPSINRWPKTIHSAETLLIRREGDDALCLNKLRDQKDAALTLRIPLTHSQELSVQAALGREGFLEGRNDQGKRVLAYIQAVSDSPWVLISCIDMAEFQRPLQERFWGIMGLIGLLIAGAGIITGGLWREQWIRFYQAQFKSAEELRQRNEDFLLALKAARMGDWSWNIVTGEIVWSDQCKALYGLPPESDIDYDTFLNAIHPDDRELVSDSLRLSVENKTPYALEKRTVWPDGSIHWNSSLAQVFCNLAGETIRMTGMTYDITEQKQLELSLEGAERTLRTIFENAFDGILVADVKSASFVMANESFCHMLGYERDELLRLHVTDIHPQECLPYIMDRFERRMSLSLDIPVLRKDGFVFYTDISASEIEIEGRMCLVGIFRDITERKKMEAERDRLFMAIEQSTETILITDVKGSILYVNPAFEKVTGYSREEAIGQNPRVLKSGEHDEAFYVEMWQCLSKGNLWRGRMINKKKNGDLYTEDAVISPVRDATGSIINFVAVKHDVTEHLKIQAEKEKLQAQFLQAQKMEAVGRLAGGVAHDFNNIIMAIRGYSDLVLRKLSDDAQLKKDVQEIKNAADRAILLTRQLLTFARKETIRPLVLDLNDAVLNMIKMLQRLIGEDIKLNWKPSPEHCLIKIDPSQIDQILANLAVNARDAISGVGNLTIETFQIEFDESYCSNHAGFTPGKFVCLMISDDGCGMDKETMNNIFEPFFTTKGMGKGTGLGLSTVFGIVKQNEGFIHVYSELGEGTIFRMYFPLIDSPSVPRQEIPTKTIRRTGVETVLFIDDDKEIVDIGQRMLEDMGYTVLAAITPKEAIQIMETRNDIQLLITDVVMPEMNGKELYRKLAFIKPNLKCLYMSGYTKEIIALRGLLEESERFISKPFSAEDISAKIREIFD